MAYETSASNLSFLVTSDQDGVRHIINMERISRVSEQLKVRPEQADVTLIFIGDSRVPIKLLKPISFILKALGLKETS